MKKIIMLVCVLLLTGCSAKFAYNNASWLVYWYIDDFVELNDQQEDQFDALLGDWIDWHTSSELPKYEAHLSELIDDIRSRQIDVERIAYHREKGRQHWERARAHVTPGMVSMAKTLSDDQITYFFAKLEKDNLEDEEDMQETRELKASERAKKWIKRNEKGAKRWIGRLNDEQTAHIAQYQDRFARTGNYWLDYKRSYQQALRETFAAGNRDEAFEQRLSELILNPDTYRSDEFVAASDSNNLAGAEYLVGLFNLASDKQLNSLIEEIEDLREDVQSLQKK